MKPDLVIQLQSYLDGELSSAEARTVEAHLNQDPTARQLLDELRQMKALLRDNEPTCVVPASREFYWSRIQAAIQREAQPATRPVSVTQWLRAHLHAWRGPAAGLATAAVVILAALHLWDWDFTHHQGRYWARVESPSAEMGAYSFRCQSENVFVVWLYDQPAPAESEASFIDDLILQ